MKFIAVYAIKFYQKNLKHIHNRECIYEPSCSNYTIMAIKKYGTIKGCYYGLLRIKRCNGALFQGGEDLP